MPKSCVRLLRLVLPATGIVYLLSLFSALLLAQATPPSADTFVSSATPRTNYGSSIILIVQPGANSYLQFNLSTLPPGASVNKATLRLYVDAVAKTGSFDVYQLNAGWNENTLTFNTPAPALGISATGGKPVSISSSSLNQFLLIDVTPLVQGWVNGTIPNNGVGLALISGSSASFSMDAKESLLTPNGPELEIVLNGPAGPQGLQGPQGPQGLQGNQGLQGLPGPVLPDLVYSDQINTFTTNQVLQGNLLLAPTGGSTAAQGFNSYPFDLQASAFDGVKPQHETFRWQTEPTGNNSPNASGTLNLLFGGGNGATPAETGLSLTSNGGLNLKSIAAPGNLSITAANDTTFFTQHDFNMVTDNDNTQATHGNFTTSIDKNNTETIHANSAITIDKDSLQTIHGVLTVTSDKDVNLTAGAGMSLQANGNLQVSAAQSTTLTTGTNLAVTTGANLTVSTGSSTSLLTGNDFAITTGKTLNLISGTDLNVQSNGNATLTVAKDLQVSSNGDAAVTTGKNFNLLTGGTLSVQSSSDALVNSGGDLGAVASKDLTLTSGHDLTLTSDGNTKLNASGTMTLEASGTIEIKAALVQVDGLLSKGGGTFKIDHPLDPLNKFLYHSFVESPDMMNVYNGNVTTNKHGVATIVLPDYFEALNRDFRYQLTVIGQFSQAIVARKIRNNHFVIKTNRPRVEVSWQVTGIRQDPFANLHRIQVEEQKPEEARGHYLHPDAYEKQQATVAALPAR